MSGVATHQMKNQVTIDAESVLTLSEVEFLGRVQADPKYKPLVKEGVETLFTYPQGPKKDDPEEKHVAFSPISTMRWANLLLERSLLSILPCNLSGIA